MPRLSAIVPTRDRPAVLRDCLLSLQAQTIDHDLFEVVVVDDGSEAGLEKVVKTAAAGPFPIRLERQEAAGLNAARNRGAAVSTAGVLAFLDDDTLVSPGWARAIVGAFDDTGCSAVAGRVELLLEGPEPRWLEAKRGYLSEFELGPRPRRLDRAHLPVGANCAVDRAIFQRLGGFRAGLDRIGDSLVSNGDTEFFLRVHDLGGPVLYVPDAHVRHRIPAERLSLSYARERAYAQGISDELLGNIDGSRNRFARRLRELLRLGRAAPILAKGIVQGRGATNARLWVDYCRGRLSALGVAPDAANSSSSRIRSSYP